MNIYIVHSISDGYAREDAKVTVIYGAFTDESIATKLSVIKGAKVSRVELDYLHPSYEEAMKELFKVL